MNMIHLLETFSSPYARVLAFGDERSLHCTNPEAETPVRLPAMESPVPSTANGAAGPGGSEKEEEAA